MCFSLLSVLGEISCSYSSSNRSFAVHANGSLTNKQWAVIPHEISGELLRSSTDCRWKKKSVVLTLLKKPTRLGNFTKTQYQTLLNWMWCFWCLCSDVLCSYNLMLNDKIITFIFHWSEFIVFDLLVQLKPNTRPSHFVNKRPVNTRPACEVWEPLD